MALVPHVYSEVFTLVFHKSEIVVMNIVDYHLIYAYKKGKEILTLSISPSKISFKYI